MTDDLVKKFYNKYVKDWFKENGKYLVVIILYLLYQSNFLIALLSSFGFSISSLPKTIRMISLAINDLIYVITILLMFKKEIREGLIKLKKNFINEAYIGLNCWVIGCVIMTVSSFIISLILKESVSGNEASIRESIKLAPAYMLFTCSVVAPILEEMVFRRSFHGLIKNKWVFILFSGLSFGALHVLGSFTNPLDFLYVIPYGSMGCCFAYLLTKTNNITLPILIHMIHNTILVTIQIYGG